MAQNQVLVTVERLVDGFSTTTNLARIKRYTFLPETRHNGYFQTLEDAIRSAEVTILTVGGLGFTVELYVGSKVDNPAAIREMLERISAKQPKVVTNRHEFFVTLFST